MTPDQIDLLQDSFALLRAQADAVATVFCSRLHEIDPEARALLRGSAEEQQKKLMMMMATIVAALTHSKHTGPAVRALGVRHVEYGVQPQHYDSVRDAMLWTLERCLGRECTPEVERVWRDGYERLATAMKQSAERAPISLRQVAGSD